MPSDPLRHHPIDRRSALRVDQAERIYDVLVDMAGAREDGRQAFIAYVIEPITFGHEWRFMGLLGFGGKLHVADFRGAYIGCYPEDLNEVTRPLIEAVNAKLAEIAPSREALSARNG